MASASIMSYTPGGMIRVVPGLFLQVSIAACNAGLSFLPSPGIAPKSRALKTLLCALMQPAEKNNRINVMTEKICYLKFMIYILW